ncbi:ECF RNA polymerase sigma factor SigE [Planctomycetes bacterium Poly30]|uniref:ECF RNA polymerase sigma factor SigE n=1 Tax=Saltatorellus ferox TaxID=2528018 RepID=A0A518EVP2_9BACT|nr:ECF RNA polymerase sigma factor SigE [Planctomycetes bacterium Poly30]
MNHRNEELLKQQDEWLRRMARHLVGKASAAEDLAQDTWVAGIEAGAARVTLRPWLFRVLSNKASGARSGQRRADDALRMVQREARLEASAPDEAVADLELRERVLRELQALDEPLRTAIHQVYFLGLSTREAGAALGVSHSTVAQRTQKGLDALRVRLDRAYGGERKLWTMILAPAIARGSGGAAAAGASVVRNQAGRALGTMKIAGGAALLAGAGWLASRALLEPVATPVSLGSVTAVAPDPSPVAPRGPAELAALGSRVEPALRSAVSAPDSATQNATITARFLLPGGEPAAGARWSLSGMGASEERVRQFGLPDDWETLRGQLDGDGNLVLTFDPPQAMQFFLTVWDEGVVPEGVVPEGVVAESWRWGHVRPEERKEIGTVRFLEACELRGFVVDENDQPIVGRAAWIRAEEAVPVEGGGREPRCQRVQLDPATGSFVLDAVPAGKMLVSASGALRTRAPEPVEVELGSGNEMLLSIDSSSYGGGRIEARVCHSAFSFREDPVPLECVWLEAPDGLHIAATEYRARSRSYVFECAPDGPLSLVAEHPAIEPVRVENVDSVPMLSFSLIGSSGLLWSVTGPDGESVDQYSIEMTRHDSKFLAPVRALHPGESSLPDGLLEGLWPGTYGFTVRSPLGSATIEVQDLGAGERRPVAVALAPTLRVTGRLIRPSGQAVAGETVRLVMPAEENDSHQSLVVQSPVAVAVHPTHRRCIERLLSDDAGRFEFTVDAPGRYLVVGGDEMRPMAWSEFLDLEAGAVHDPVTLTLAEPSGIMGSFEPPAHLPRSGWMIQLEREGSGAVGGSRNKPAVDDEGRFHIPSLSGGTYRLYATLRAESSWLGEEMRPHGAYSLGSVEVRAGEMTEAVDLRILAPVPAQVGVTLQPSGELEGSVQVMFRPLGREGAWMSTGTKGTVSAIEPAILEPGAYAVSFQGKGWRAFDPRELLIPENEAVTITVPLDVSEHRVQLFRGGEPLRRARVTLTSPANESHRRFASNAYDVDEDGWLEARLSSGTWKLFLLEEGDTGPPAPAVDFVWPPASDTLDYRN